jgi:hypothetical protein
MTSIFLLLKKNKPCKSPFAGRRKNAVPGGSKLSENIASGLKKYQACLHQA